MEIPDIIVLLCRLEQKQELSYRKQIVRQLCTQYVADINSNP